MLCRQTGFSLVEALVTLLVLSIGWLGLGQLQARLSVASLNQSGSAYAHLVQSIYYEKIVSYELSAVLSDPPGDTTLSSPFGTYRVQLSSDASNALNNTVIQVEWRGTEAPRREIISLSISTYTTPSDTRWLLSTP